jgi:hypothetical protein
MPCLHVSLRIAVVASLLALAPASWADSSHNYGPYPSNYNEECGSCHVPYPPQRMTSAGWEMQMRNLDKHYGVDASLDAPASKAIRTYLLAHAGQKEKLAPNDPTARMTLTRWFVKEHGATPPKGKTFSDCTQCHTLAAKGEYDEHSIKVPADWHREK